MSATTISGNGTLDIYQVGGNTVYKLNGGAQSSPCVFPITISTTEGLLVNFTSDMTINTGQYFILDGENITVDGGSHVITMNAAGYVGLFSTPTISIDIGATHTVQNLSVIGSSQSNTIPTGWICTNNYGSISNCYVAANVIAGSAGICYSNSGTITNCHTSMNITAGGCAAIAIYNLVGSTISDCYSTGDISNSSTGLVIFNSSTVQNCYSTGSISSSSGGICGVNQGGSINNCYSTGQISINSAGICLLNQATINNCYTSGSSQIITNGIISPQYTQSGTINNCYAMSSVSGQSGWNNDYANLILQGVGTTTWYQFPDDAPYLLLSFVGTNYAGVNLNLNVNIPSGAPQPVGTYSSFPHYSLLSEAPGSVSINETGALTGSQPGSFSFQVLYQNSPTVPYAFNNLTLNITDPSENPPCLLEGCEIMVVDDDNKLLYKDVSLLKEGDRVLSSFSKQAKTIKRMISTRVNKHQIDIRNLPFQLKKNAFANDVPDKDIRISGFHRVILGGQDKSKYTGVQVFKLCPSTAVAFDELPEEMVYYNIELEDIDAVFCNNLAVESFNEH